MKKQLIKKYESLLCDVKDKLSKHRSQHCINVAEEAVKLAKLYGENEKNAYIAGLLHDIMKELDKNEMLEYIKSSDKNIEEAELDNSALWHGIASSIYAEKIGIDNIDILNAIRYHTVARENMSKLEKIIYLADMVSADRNYPDVDVMRKLTYESLDKAMLYALTYTIKKQSSKSACIPVTTIKAYNYFCKSENR